MRSRPLHRIRRVAGVLIIALPLGLGALTAPATAQESRGATPPALAKAVEDSPEELREYWTPERIEQALANPMDSPAKRSGSAPRTAEPEGAGSPTVVSADAVPPASAAVRTSDTLAAASVSRSVRVTDTTAWPNSAVGKLLFRTAGGEDRMCSAASITSVTRNAIWTAAHCLHGGRNEDDFNTSFIFLPAYDNGWYPGFWFAARVIVPADWARNQDVYDADMGAIVLQPNSSYGNLQDYVGAFGYTFGNADHGSAHSFGYPANGYNRPDSDFAGAEYQMYCSGSTVDAANWNPLDNRLRMNCDMGGGASGGPMAIGVGTSNVRIIGANSHRNVDSAGNWADNYLFSSEHSDNAAAVIDLVNG